MPDLTHVDGLPEPLYYPTSSDAIRMERQQLIDEGKVIDPVAAELEALIDGDSPRDGSHDDRARELYERTRDLETRADYPYTEPSELAEIRAARPGDGASVTGELDRSTARSAIHGGWVGACAGCLLGKPVQGWEREKIVSYLEASDQYPLDSYIHDRVDEATAGEYEIYLNIEGRGADNSLFIDDLDQMPLDDDIDYIAVGLGVLEEHGRSFEPVDVANYWLGNLPIFNTYTAERVAYINFANRVTPPDSAVVTNPFREHVGALIRADPWGYVCLGDPSKAAELAFRDASISHVKNGIYGEMWAAAMIAVAPVADNPREVIEAGLQEIPAESRLTKAIGDVLEWHAAGVDYEGAVERIHDRWDETDTFHWVHTIPNAQIVAMALLWGGGEFGRSIARAVQAGIDTDSHGATVGSVLGAAHGLEAVPDRWVEPLDDTVATSLVEYQTTSIAKLADTTLDHWS